MAPENTRELRRQIAESGQCPFNLAALALERNNRLQQRIAELEAKLKSVK